jgi:hypothetical protein
LHDVQPQKEQRFARAAGQPHTKTGQQSRAENACLPSPVPKAALSAGKHPFSKCRQAVESLRQGMCLLACSLREPHIAQAARKASLDHALPARPTPPCPALPCTTGGGQVSSRMTIYQRTNPNTHCKGVSQISSRMMSASSSCCPGCDFQVEDGAIAFHGQARRGGSTERER